MSILERSNGTVPLLLLIKYGNIKKIINGVKINAKKREKKRCKRNIPHYG